MSRSRRKHPIKGLAGRSDKKDKRLANRRLRRLTKICLSSSDLQQDFTVLPVMREVSDPWDFSKDGKIRIDSTSKWMRK